MTTKGNEVSELIARLLAGTGGGKHWMDLHEEAATAITKLQSENAALRQRVAELEKNFNDAIDSLLAAAGHAREKN